MDRDWALPLLASLPTECISALAEASSSSTSPLRCPFSPQEVEHTSAYNNRFAESPSHLARRPEEPCVTRHMWQGLAGWTRMFVSLRTDLRLQSARCRYTWLVRQKSSGMASGSRGTRPSRPPDLTSDLNPNLKPTLALTLTLALSGTKS